MSDNLDAGRLEAGKAWLKEQAEEMGATDVEWGQADGDFDRNRQSIRMRIRGALVVCTFSEFDLPKIPTDENVARAARQQLQACLKGHGGEQDDRVG